MRDPDDFDDFYRLTVTRLTRFACSYTADAAAAQDLAQETYARAWRNWDRLREYDNPEAWLRAVAARLAASRWRRMRRYAATLARLQPSHADPPPVDDAVVLVAALRRLSTPVRTAMVLHYLLDQPVAAIAAEQDVPIGTVKDRLARGRAQLARLLDASVGPPDASGPSASGTVPQPGATHGREVPRVH
jgi:RNA polymerase sigma-70 factor, ECF subfamily